MHYSIEALDLNAHLFRVKLSLPASKKPTTLKLPVWIPGSYMVREFSRHIVQISAQTGKTALAVEQIAKNAWRIDSAKQPRLVTYEVYAFDQSVRTAWLDTDRAFFNGSSVFMYTDETRHERHTVDIAKPHDKRCKQWQVATSLKPSKGVASFGFGRYSASDYDELIDKPVTMARFQTLRFEAQGTPHHIVITGAGSFDSKRLIADVKRICEAQIALFDPKRKRAPFEQYLFMLHASGDGYGGLEHRDSTALIARRADLPQSNSPMSEGYLTLLGLFSHEYFHAWNVKRIKPARFEPYDLEQENLTRLLWLFEGFTSYYDDLMLLRAGVITEAQYLKLLSKTLTSVLSMPGRQIESVANASYNAWVKYYRADENTPNSTISYYQKGALVALALEALLREHTVYCLDDVMRHLYQQYSQLGAAYQGLGEHELAPILREHFGLSKKIVDTFFALHVNGTTDAPWVDILHSLGVELKATADTSGGATTIGGRLEPKADGIHVLMVFSAGALQGAGLAKGDVIVALEGEQCNSARWESIKARLGQGRALPIHYFRDGLLRHTQLTPAKPATKEWLIERRASA